MHVILYHFLLAMVFLPGITMMIQPYRQTRDHMQTLEDIQRAGFDFIGAHCNALPDSVTGEQLQGSGHLPHSFDDQGVAFTWRLAEHPVVSINVAGDPDYLAFLARQTSGGFEADSSYSFLPDYDNTFFRAANSGYNLFAYAGENLSCDT